MALSHFGNVCAYIFILFIYLNRTLCDFFRERNAEAANKESLEQASVDTVESLQQQLEKEKEEQRRLLQEQLEREKEEQRRLLQEQLEKEKEEQRKLLLEQLEKEKEEQRRKLQEQKEVIIACSFKYSVVVSESLVRLFIPWNNIASGSFSVICTQSFIQFVV